MFEKTASREENGWKAARESSRGNDFELREFSDATLYVFNSQPQAGVKTFNTLIRAGEPNVAIMKVEAGTLPSFQLWNTSTRWPGLECHLRS